MENTENVEQVEKEYEASVFDKVVALSYIIMVFLEYGILILRTLMGVLLGTLILQSDINSNIIIALFIYAIGLSPILKLAKSAAEQSIVNNIMERMKEDK